MQKKHSHKLAYKITFLAALVLFVSCKERKVPAQNPTVAQTTVTPPETDPPTTVVLGRQFLVIPPLAIPVRQTMMTQKINDENEMD
jgi:hypothetical protein